MKILIVGCSITCGMPENNWINWAQHFTNLSGHQIYNMSLGGASMQFIAWTLLQSKKLFNPDYIIVQKTYPHRINMVNPEFNIKNHIIQKHNYTYLDYNLRMSGDVVTITPGNVKGLFTNDLPKISFAKWYFAKQNTQYSLTNYEVYDEWLSNHSDFSFNNDYFRDINGNTKYKLDKFGHLNDEGSKLLAERVYNDVKRNLH